MLLDALQASGGEVRFRTELTGFALDPGGVRARLRPRSGAAPYDVTARYLVGADGPASGVRSALGIGVEHLGSEGEHVTALFAADLDAVVPDPPYALHAVTDADVEGIFVAAGRHRWTYGWKVDPAVPVPHAHDPGWMAQRIRAAVGEPHLDLRIDGIFDWSFAADVATSYRAGPVFLVGDAATRTTPRGATGMNTGMAAAHGLAWKLAWVLRGWAGEALLDTYEEERRPVGWANAARSLQPVAPDAEDLDRQDFDVAYASAVVLPDDPALADDASAAGAAPGRRAPHALLDPQHGTSTLDLFDGRLTLLTGPDGEGWRAAADRLAAAAGIPLAGLQFGRDVADPDGATARRYGVRDGGAVLVRPDGHVAWRTSAAARDAGRVLREVVDVATGRAPAESLGAVA